MNLEQWQQWIQENINEDVDRLRLRYHGHQEYQDAITQIDCRQRTRKKLPDFCVNSSFIFPSTLAAEQSTSQVVATLHASLVKEGATVLDLTCGLGIDTFCISRRAKHVTAVEIDANKADCARKNAATLGLDNIDVICDDSNDFLLKNKKRFDIIFVDPARRDFSGGRVFSFKECAPDIVSLLPLLLKTADEILVKASPMLDVDSVINIFAGHVAEVIAVGTRTECKELLIRLVACEVGKDDVMIRQITLFDSSKSIESPQNPDAKILYEPYPSAMKVRCWNEFTKHPSVTKLSKDTHLFTSNELIEGLPGLPYEIIDVIAYDKRGISEVSKRCPRINVATRGMGIEASDLRKRLKVKEGGDQRIKLFGVKDDSGKRLMIIARAL